MFKTLNPIKHGFLLFIALLIFLLLYWWHYNPLPSDEEMIAHFNAHRTQIEELVKSYRGFVSGKGKVWGEIPANKALMAKAGVKRVKTLGPMWFPNPYTIDGAKRFYDLMKRQHGVNELLYDSIGVELVNKKRPRTTFASVLLSNGSYLIFKELIYFPEVPKISDGKIWWPTFTDGSTRSSRLFSTLDEYPPDWKKAECVYRKIDPNWFIYMCIAAT